jgi:hypothetical protein
MLQNAIDTMPPNLNVVWRRTRNGPRVHRKMWNWSQFPSPPALASHDTRFRVEYRITPTSIINVPAMPYP